jgi:hypothetical protein
MHTFKSRIATRTARTAGGLLVMAALAGAFGGCVQIKPGTAAREWSLTMREMQIVPVFPPREGVQPGDLYFIESDQLAGNDGLAITESQLRKGFLPIGSWLGRVDLRSELAMIYANDVTFAPTPLSTSVDDAAGQARGALPQPIKEQPISSPDADGLLRPRVVAFPEFMSATFSSGDVSALVPVEALNIAASAGFTDQRSVKLSLPIAEWYGVPSTLALDRILRGDQLIDGPGLRVDQIKRLFDGRAGLSDGAGGGRPQRIFLRLVTEVYMARAVDVSVSQQRSQGARLSVKPLGTPPAEGTGAATPATAPVDSTGTDPDPVALARQLNTQLDSAMAGLALPGGSVRFVSAGVSGVSMRRMYERPVVVGYRAVTLDVRLNPDNQPYVAAARTTDTMVPTGLTPDKRSEGKPAGSTPPANTPQSTIPLGPAK